MNQKTYLVGGAVRDHLLGIESRDRDFVVVGATTQDMLDAGFQQVGSSFPVFLHPETGDEYALARTERKTGAGYYGFETVHDTGVTLTDDLMRRDLTINSMAMDLETGEIIDPFNGQEDLRNGILRHTSAAFAEDPLRVLRVARFAARYSFKIAPETINLASFIIHELASLSGERIWNELEKGFSEPYPEQMLQGLIDCGAMNVEPLKSMFGERWRSGWVGTGIIVDRFAANKQKVKKLSTDLDQNIDLLILLSMKPLRSAPNEFFMDRKIPSMIRDAARTIDLLKGVFNDPIPANVLFLMKKTRFAQEQSSAIMQLAITVCWIEAENDNVLEFFDAFMNRLNEVALWFRATDFEAVAKNGDPKTIGKRVEAMKKSLVDSVFTEN